MMTQEQITILLADDHPAVRAGIRHFIERDPLLFAALRGGAKGYLLKEDTMP